MKGGWGAAANWLPGISSGDNCSRSFCGYAALYYFWHELCVFFYFPLLVILTAEDMSPAVFMGSAAG